MGIILGVVIIHVIQSLTAVAGYRWGGWPGVLVSGLAWSLVEVACRRVKGVWD